MCTLVDIIAQCKVAFSLFKTSTNQLALLLTEQSTANQILTV